MLNKRINILLLTFDFPPAQGGVAQVMEKIVYCLKEKGICVLTTSVFNKEGSPINTDLLIFRRSFRLDVHRLKLPFELIGVLTSTLKIYLNHRFKIIVVGEVFPLGFIGLIFKLFFRVSFITMTHGTDSLLGPSKIRNFFVSSIYKTADRVLCFSDYTCGNLFKRGIRKERVRKIPMGIDIDLFSPNTDTGELKEQFKLKDKKVILTVNRLTERKGIDTVMTCLLDLVKEDPGLVYIVVGDGADRKRLENLATNLNLKNQIMFIGEIKHQSLPAFYCLSDIFINAVREIRYKERIETEGLGLVNLEASACAKPIIAGATGGVLEAIEDNRTGLLVDPTRPEEIKMAIRRLFGDQAFAKRLGEAARAKVLRQFTMEYMQEALHNVLLELR